MRVDESVIQVYAYYRQDCSDFIVSMFVEALKNYDPSAVREAFNKHIQDPDAGKFCPKVADIVAILSGGVNDNAMIAWTKAFNAIKQHGSYEDVCFDDGRIHSTVEALGGWVEFCKMNVDEISYWQHRFCETYRAHSKRNIKHPKLCFGIACSHNRLAGFDTAKPRVVGNIESARLVYKNGGDERVDTNAPALVGSIKKRLVK